MINFTVNSYGNSKTDCPKGRKRNNSDERLDEDCNETNTVFIVWENMLLHWFQGLDFIACSTFR